jgi:hypothetical protein
MGKNKSKKNLSSLFTVQTFTTTTPDPNFAAGIPSNSYSMTYEQRQQQQWRETIGSYERQQQMGYVDRDKDWSSEIAQAKAGLAQAAANEELQNKALNRTAKYNPSGLQLHGYNMEYFSNRYLRHDVGGFTDYIYDYKGPRGGRETNEDVIFQGLLAGNIQTNTYKALNDFHSMTRNHGKSEKWDVTSYKQVALLDFMGGTSKLEGAWGPMRYGAGDVDLGTSDAGRKRLKGLAGYISAVNTELNIKDDEEDLAALMKENSTTPVTAPVKLQKNPWDDEDAGKNVRYKLAIAGRSVK